MLNRYQLQPIISALIITPDHVSWPGAYQGEIFVVFLIYASDSSGINAFKIAAMIPDTTIPETNSGTDHDAN